MRKHFEDTLKIYSDLAKDKIKNEEEDKKDIDLAKAVDWHLRNKSEKRQTNISAQKHIFTIQEIKQETMRDLELDLKNLNGLERKKCSRFVNLEENVFYVVGEDGAKTPVSRGELMTDGEWGIEYFLDQETVSRNTRKRYIIENYKRKLRLMLDKQITIDESKSELTHELKRKAYEAIKNRVEKEEKGIEEANKEGVVAEKMVKNFLKKISLDFDNADFEIIEADAYQDVEMKCDFFIRRKKVNRGIKVDADFKEGDIGIQFTTVSSDADSNGVIARKERQIGRVNESLNNMDDTEKKLQDVVLVSVPAIFAANLYKQWDEAGRPSGGPDKFWNPETKEKIYRGVMSKVFTEEEIKDHLAKIRNNFSQKTE